MYKISVLMSTYNGEKFIERQIESILEQTSVNIQLLIRDDGSTDSTAEIIRRKYISLANVKFIKGENIGYANSFMMLIKVADKADYYSFADQDDIWEPEKIINGIRRLEGHLNAVYASALKVVDENENYQYIKKFSGMPVTIGSVLSRNRMAGCTMIFGNELKNKLCRHIDEVIKFNTFNYGHDGWILLYCLSVSGNVIIDDNSYINYRRHPSTVTNLAGGVWKRIKNELKIFINVENRRQKIASFLLESINADWDRDAYNVLKLISGYKKSPKLRLELFLSKSIKTNIPVVDIKNRLAIALGRY